MPPSPIAPKFLVGKNGLEPPYSLSDYQAVKSADESMMLCMSNEPKIVISAAGMLTGGRVMHHLKAKLPYSRNAVLFVGYQPEGTKGRLLKNGLSTIRIHHQTIHVEAEVLAIDSLSAHADSDDLVGWLKQIKIMPRTIFLNHGESSALEALNYRIKNELKWSSIIVDEGQTVVLD